jgi:UDP-N-acetylmuramate--alanine ligase
MVGIGGIGMSALARLLVQLGYKVTGSDIHNGNIINDLRALGIEIQVGHLAENIKNADCLVISSSIRDENSELKAARMMNIPVIHRGEMLAILMDAERGIAVSGTHGKSTTTAMLAYILEAANWDPSAYVGAIVPKYKANAKSGTGDWFVAEADESDESFLRLNPEIAVITNIDLDHVDHYKEAGHLHSCFKRFLEKLPSRGFGVISADDIGVGSLGGIFGKPLVTFGIDNPADCNAVDIVDGDFCSTFQIVWRGDKLGAITINAPGRFNVQNALAAAATALALGIDFHSIKLGLEEYKGISRRFEIHKNNGFMVVDDYAHHPTEVKATLSGARANTSRRIIAVFQPHRYTRTQFFADEYGRAFDDADEVIVTDIYSAGENPIDNVNSRMVIDSIRKSSKVTVTEVSSLEDVINRLRATVKPGDIIITMGAGDVHQVASTIANDPSVLPDYAEMAYHMQTG